MLISVLLVVSFTLVVPVILIWILWRRPEASRFAWLLEVLYTGGFVLYALLVGRWDWVGYYLRYVLGALFVVAAVASYRSVRAHRIAIDEGRGIWRTNAGALVTVVIVAGLLAWTVSGYFYRDASVQLSFPLANGWFYVGQGGNSPIINYHNTVRSQRYALDIVALNALGVRARGVYPTALDRYVIYGATVLSPCDGTVAAVVDGLPDQIPPASDAQYPAGNHVVISCRGVNVLLAHLRPDSIVVQTGQTVVSGQPVAAVGNSGNTTEPHLHMHAVRDESGDASEGEGVPMLFEGRFPVRNSTWGE